MGEIAINVPRGNLHIREEENQWRIYVPQTQKNRYLCYSLSLPEALTRRFHIPSAAKDIINNVLNGPISIIDDILEAEGIGKVGGIEAPPRQGLEEEEGGETSEHEIIAVEETVGSSRALRAQSAPLPATRDRMTHRPRSGYDIEAGGHLAESETSSSGDEEENTPRSQATPASSAVRRSASPYFAQQINIPRDPANPDIIGRRNDDVYAAYRNLLDHVIQLASQRDLPSFNSREGFGNGQFHEGFDHAEAFGNRTQGQMSHDTKIGAAGELFVSTNRKLVTF
jgi:hypothetical protein